LDIFKGRLGGALLLATVSCAIIAVAAWFSSEKWPATLPPLAAGTAIIAVIFFIGVLMLGYTSPGPITLEGVRHAIAASFVVTFLVLIGLTAWFPGQKSSTDTNTTTTEAGATQTAKDLLDGFIDLLKIIIPFYFVVEGASRGAVRFQELKGARAELERQRAELELQRAMVERS
jgi:hypothetical protein